MTARIGSLFSGYAGLDLAVEQVFGAEPAWFVEYDAAPSRILAHHYPNVPNYGDVTTVDWASVPPIDILTGGYPCQPFSAAGQRKGTDDERHLWPYVREAIRVLRPRFAILENVAGHRSLGFDRVLGDMAEDGMRVWWTSIQASDIGAPHFRERVFILAETPDAASLGWNRREGERTGGREAPEWSQALDRPPHGGNPHSRATSRSATTAVRVHLPTPTASDYKTGQPPEKRKGHNLRIGDVVLDANWKQYAPVIRDWEAVFRTAPAPTELNRNSRPHLAAAFSEWMMGLPAGWVTDVPDLSRAEQLKAIGNGVCPPQAVAAIRELLELRRRTIQQEAA